MQKDTRSKKTKIDNSESAGDPSAVPNSDLTNGSDKFSPSNDAYFNSRSGTQSAQESGTDFSHQANFAQTKGEQKQASRNSAHEGAASKKPSNEAPSFFKSLEHDAVLLAKSFDALFQWCLNTSEIAALEAKTAIMTLPKFIMARIGFVVLQFFSWILIVVTASYAVYAYTGSVPMGLAMALSMQAILSAVFLIYIQKMRKKMQFTETHREWRSVKDFIHSDHS